MLLGGTLNSASMMIRTPEMEVKRRRAREKRKESREQRTGIRGIGNSRLWARTNKSVAGLKSRKRYF